MGTLTLIGSKDKKKVIFKMGELKAYLHSERIYQVEVKNNLFESERQYLISSSR